MSKWKKLLAFIVPFFMGAPVFADGGSRVNQSPDNPVRKLIKQFNTNADSLYNGNPNSGNLTTTRATGKSPADGLITVALGDITPTTTLTVWFWQPDMAKWVHMGAGAADYSKEFDADYTSAQFAVPPNIAYLITADKAITSSVYVSGKAYKDNANSATGFDQ